MSELLPPTMKTLKIRKSKCFRGDKCEYHTRNRRCRYSHGPNDVWLEKKVPAIDINHGIYTRFDEFTGNAIFIPEAKRLKDGGICKIVDLDGKGEVPRRMDKVTFRSYGVVFQRKSKEDVKKEMERRRITDETIVSKMSSNVFVKVLVNRKNLKVNMINGACSKNATFYHYILRSMKEGERAYFRVHPKYMILDENGQKERLKMDDSIVLLSNKELAPEQYVYYYFVVDRIAGKRDVNLAKKLNSLKTYKKVFPFIDEKMREFQSEKVKIFSKSFKNNDDKLNLLRALVKKYNILRQHIMGSRHLSTLKVTEPKAFQCRTKLLISLNLRAANISLICEDYERCEKHCKFALNLDKLNFQARYYLSISLRRRKKKPESLAVIREIENLVKEKNVELSDGEIAKIKKEKSFLKEVILEEKKSVFEFGKKLKKGLSKGSVYEKIDQEICDDFNKKMKFQEANSKKCWNVNGREIFVDARKSQQEQWYELCEKMGGHPNKDEDDEDALFLKKEIEQNLNKQKLNQQNSTEQESFGIQEFQTEYQNYDEWDNKESGNETNLSKEIETQDLEKKDGEEK